jgi:ribosomal protein S18 acetylase RimI-like enzyme
MPRLDRTKSVAIAHTFRRPRIAIVAADHPIRIEAVRELFREYAASLSFNLCFQGFEEELARLPGEYAFPSGMLLLGLVDNQSAGCVALHRLDRDLDVSADPDLCEMKRLFVRPDFRSCGLGHELVNAILNCAAAIGYRRMRLDTVPSEMGSAVHLYRKLGFVEIPAYRVNPVAGATYMELDLKDWQARCARAATRAQDRLENLR